ncbi:hypothetical protein CPC08DRAFT_766334 [Agrocybe pediades]|nr:hypothetical protein CPC08DRAFT_766334 [Agrocybe pediades]
MDSHLPPAQAAGYNFERLEPGGLTFRGDRLSFASAGLHDAHPVQRTWSQPPTVDDVEQQNQAELLSTPLPASYVAGLGRGASGFITGSDIGPAIEGPSADKAQARRSEKVEPDPDQFQDPDNQYGLFAATTYKQDGAKADQVVPQPRATILNTAPTLHSPQMIRRVYLDTPQTIPSNPPPSDTHILVTLSQSVLDQDGLPSKPVSQ